MATKKTAKKKPARKAAAKPVKKTTKKATAKKAPVKKAAKKVAKKAATKKAATKKAVSKPAKKAVSKKTEKKVTEKKTAKKAAKKTSTKKSRTASEKAEDKRSAEAEKRTGAAAQGGKPKIAIDLPPKNYKRRVAPGVRIEVAGDEVRAKGSGSAAVEAQKLSAKDLRDIRERLIELRDNIIQEIKHQVDDSLNRTSVVASDPADRAADVYDGDVSFEIAASGRRELDEIEKALEKIDQKTYGQCEQCSSDIGAGRLKVKPFAVLCTGCRREKEISGDQDGESIWGFLDADAEESGEE